MARVDHVPSRAEQIAQEAGVSAAQRMLLAKGAAEWDERRFFDAHETWEELWMEEPRPIRSFFQGLILLAAGLHHWTGTHKPRGVQTKLSAGIERLAPYAPALLGVDVSAAIGAAGVLLREAAGLDSARLAATPAETFPKFPWAGSSVESPPESRSGGGMPVEGGEFGAGPELLVQRLRESAALPRRATALSSGLDLRADLGGEGEMLALDPGGAVAPVPTGIAIALPPGFEAQVRPRSGLWRKGVDVGFGTIDADYRGELIVQLALRPGAGPFSVRHGDRIAQLVIAPVALAAVREAGELDETERGAGGFGSTGR